MDIVMIDIGGHDNGEMVISRFFVQGLFLFVLRFTLDSSNPASLQSRIVNCFFEHPVLHVDVTFADRTKMREAINQAANYAIPRCMGNPSSKAPDAVIDVTGDGREIISYIICNESALYNEYLSWLQPLDNTLKSSQRKNRTFRFIDRASLSIIDTVVAGHGTIAIVRNPFTSDPTTMEGKYVFKGEHFSDFVTDPEVCAHIIRARYDEIAALDAMPPHPNIIPPSSIFVTTPSAYPPGMHSNTVICGTLQPFYAKGDLDKYLRVNDASLPLKAKWCYQLVSATHHAYFIGKTYHMDLKPPNLLLDENLDLVVIDWENSGANISVLPPEADGTFDVSLRQLFNGEKVIQYKKYNGPERSNNLVRPTWNVFPIWNIECRQAIELAQVYSFGRAIWMILTGVLNDELEDKDIWWTLKMEKAIPESWRKVVENCVRKDPNSRMSMEKLLIFWRDAQKGGDFLL
ncbi:kinase-like domain-containing protein [Gymnopilus junonius]|uniref:Kinase-like domain-containing protein n=1 Tax=Gymnopilus junonius TaxID=109634 RepID=A0A9P5NF11_GYMJU|nr:kinase-like domain-containing protein [Gymnopilus junonius]